MKDYAIKKNGMYESIPFTAKAVQTEGKDVITLQNKIDDGSFANYKNISKTNIVTLTNTPNCVDLKLVSKYPFSYNIPNVNPKYSNKHKIEDFLYEIQYGKLDYDYAKLNMISPFGGCSAIRNGNFFGRNFDWLYDNQVQFVVHTPSSLNYYSTLGVSGIIPGITKTTVDLDSILVDGTDMFKLLPFYLLDGINEKGLFCTTNLVPLDDHDDPTIEVLANKEEKERIPSSMLVRYILDKFCSVIEAVNYINDYVTIYFSDDIINCGYLTHFLIGDSNRTYIIEFINNDMVIKPFNYITNFLIAEVDFNKDNSLSSPFIPKGVNPYGFGLERWNIITNNYKHSNTKAGMEELLDLIKYSNCYSEPFWYSELVYNSDDDEGELINVDTPHELCTGAKEAVIEAYEERDRAHPNTWITCHSSIYDIKCKELYIKNQENDIEYKFNI